MNISQKQRLFTHLFGKLLIWCYQNGYEVSFGWPDQLWSLADKRKNGHQHGKDLMRFTMYLDLPRGEERYEAIGREWESMHPMCRWGGRTGETRGAHRFSMAFVAGRAGDGFRRPADQLSFSSEQKEPFPRRGETPNA